MPGGGGGATDDGGGGGATAGSAGGGGAGAGGGGAAAPPGGGGGATAPPGGGGTAAAPGGGGAPPAAPGAGGRDRSARSTTPPWASWAWRSVVTPGDVGVGGLGAATGVAGVDQRPQITEQRVGRLARLALVHRLLALVHGVVDRVGDLVARFLDLVEETHVLPSGRSFPPGTAARGVGSTVPKCGGAGYGRRTFSRRGCPRARSAASATSSADGRRGPRRCASRARPTACRPCP